MNAHIYTQSVNHTMNQTPNTTPSVPAVAETPDTLFTDVVREMGRRKALGQISAEMREVVEAVQATGKKGSIRLEITIVPRQAQEVSSVEVEYSVVQKLPKRPLPSSTFFLDDNGGLSRRDNRQTELEFAPKVVTPTAPAATVSGAPMLPQGSPLVATVGQ